LRSSRRIMSFALFAAISGGLLFSTLFIRPPTALAAASLSPDLTTFSPWAGMLGLTQTDPGFRLSSLEVQLEFDASGERYTAQCSADLELTAERLSNIDNWIFSGFEDVTEVSLGGAPVTIRPGVPFSSSGTDYSLSLALGEAAPDLTQGSVSRLTVKTTAEIPAQWEVHRYGLVFDLQLPLGELLALCERGTTWSLTIVVPGGWSAICQGDLVESRTTGSDEKAVFQRTQIVRNPGTNVPVVVGPYRRLGLDLPGDFGLWLLDQDRVSEQDLIAGVTETIRHTNDVMSSEMGLPALEKREVVLARVPGQGSSGKGPYGMVLLEWGRERKTGWSQDLRALMSHEICHQWFPGCVELDFMTGIWLSEGMATYFDARYLRDEWPPEKYFGMSSYEPSTYSINSASASFGTVSARDKQRVIYMRGAWVASMLQATIGDEAFASTLKRFYTQDADRPKGSPEFRAIAEEESGLDLGRFFDEWLGKATIPKISLEDLRVSRSAEGWLVSGVVRNTRPMPLPPISVSVSRSGTQMGTTTVIFEETAGEQGAQTASFEVVAPSLFASVVLDPESRILNVPEAERRASLFFVWAGTPGLVVMYVGVPAVTLTLCLLIRRRRSSVQPPPQENTPCGTDASLHRY
jgi:hypothetical protein